MDKFIFQGEALQFNQDVIATNSVNHVFDIITFIQTARPSIIFESVSQFLTFNQEALNDFSIINRTISDILFFNQLAQRVVAIEHITQALFIGQHVTNKTDHIQQTLLFIETAIGDATQSASDVLIFTDITTFTADRPVSLSDILTFVTEASFYIEDPDFIAIPLPALTPTTVTLSYTPLSLSLILRAPEFDNIEKLEFTRINRRTRGHDLIIYRDPIWPKSETLILSFRALTQTTVTSLLSFMKQTIGKDITLIDHEDREWLGIITTPTNEVIQEGVGCRFNASFEFQGNLV
jgi:hypothetical protein